MGVVSRLQGWRHLLRLRHPAQVIAFAFGVVIVAGTVLLVLPIARADPGRATFLQALFTATSATCVTGLIVVDTPVFWSRFGQVVILVLIQVGGFGIMTLASLVGLLISRRLGLQSRLVAAAETKHIGIGDLRSVVLGVAKVSLLFESVTAVALTLRFAVGYDESWWRATQLGVFHAVSAFNNAGFSLYSDNLVRFVSDPWICLPIAAAVIFGGLGFPVLFELRRRLFHPRFWSLHSRLTIGGSAVLLFGGTLFTLASEWGNPTTLGALGVPDRLLASFFHSASARTAGFNTVSMAGFKEGTLFGSDILMFIGGGSAGTSGGIKVTTFFLLFFVILSEVRGDRQVEVFDRQVDHRVWRQALTVALVSVAAVVGSALILVEISKFSLDVVLFETISAFATTGLSTGITALIPDEGQYVLIGLMYLGRLGPITLVSALALRENQRLYELPEGRPLIG